MPAFLRPAPEVSIQTQVRHVGGMPWEGRGREAVRSRYATDYFQLTASSQALTTRTVLNTDGQLLGTCRWP